MYVPLGYIGLVVRDENVRNMCGTSQDNIQCFRLDHLHNTDYSVDMRLNVLPVHSCSDTSAGESPS